MSVVEVESYLRISECDIVAAAALLAFDYCLTFGEEIEWLHGTRWTVARIHFASSRYLPFVAIALAIPASRVQPPPATSYCVSLGMASNVMYYLCIVLAEAMLIVRTYAFWKRDRRILIGICTFGVVCMVTAIVISETIASQAASSVYRSLKCTGTENTVATAIQYIFLILYELCMLALNWIAFQRMKRHDPPGRLVTTLYRDGVMYVAGILAFSIINAVVTLSTTIQYSDIFNSSQMVIHSILTSRIFFNLRETTRQEQRVSAATPLTEFHAATRSSGFSTSAATSSSSSGNDPVMADNMTQVIEVRRYAREHTVQPGAIA